MHNGLNYSANRQELLTFLRLLEPEISLDTRFLFNVVCKPKYNGFLKKEETKAYDMQRTIVNETLDLLAAYNNEREAAIFAMVNDSGGQRRGNKNITRIRALFVDIDEGGKQKLDTVLDCPHPPHLVVETSPDKYHCYWRVLDFPVEQFTPTQAQLINLFGTDRSCKDPARVMRLPGFWHMKGEPFQSRIYLENLGAPALTHCMALEWLGAPPPTRVPKYAADCPPASTQALRVLPNLHRLGWVLRQGSGRPNEPDWHIVCPWHEDHTDGREESGYYEPNEENGNRGWFKCLHAHCVDKGIRELTYIIHKTLEHHNVETA